MLFSLLKGGLSFQAAIAYLLSSLVVIFLTLPVHEWAHGFVAYKLGDNTAKYQGRLTVNPFAHIDYFGALCILLFGFGWAKPVQINARNFKNPKLGMAISALAGPVANILLAIVSFMILNTVDLFAGAAFISNDILYVLWYFLIYVAKINIYLAVFNLIPIPPLDGSRLLFAFLPTKYYFAFMKYERYIFIGLIALIWFGILDYPINFLSGAVEKFAVFIANLPFGY